MKQSETKLAFGVSLSDLDRDVDFLFDCMDNMKESFYMLRVGVVDCKDGTFYADKCFRKYVDACNKLSIPWVGYIYMHFHTKNSTDEMFLPNNDVWNIFDEISFSLPYITILLDFNAPDLDIDAINNLIQCLHKSISTKSDKQLTVICNRFAKFNNEFASHTKFEYPLYVEMPLPEGCSSFSVPDNTLLCCYGEENRCYLSVSVEDKINIHQTKVCLGAVIAMGELADIIHNYRSS